MIGKIKIVPILLILPSLCFSTIGSNGHIGKRIFPDVVFEIQETTGFYSKEEIKAVADYNMLDLRSIFLKYLEEAKEEEEEEEEHFDGNILIKFTIAKNGKTASVGIMHSTTGNAEFDDAIRKELSTWKWNATERSNNTSTVLFRFTHIYQYDKMYIINNGPRLGNEVRGTWIKHVPMLTSIRNKYLRLKPNFNGRIVLRFTIAGSGEVTNVDIIASTTEYAEFDDAIRKELSTWKWKPIEGGNTTVTVSFIFRE